MAATTGDVAVLDDVVLAGPAEKLCGLLLNGKWKVVQRLQRDPGDDGASRSACYRAVSAKNDRIAFVKAYDFRRDEFAGDTEKLERMLSEFNNEKRVHEHCKKNSLNRVTQIFDHGVEIVAGEPVHYIVCEFADRSLRTYHPPGEGGIPAHDRLIALRQTASAIVQLHQAGVAHQDVKPSNAVYFEDGLVKITDLGSSSCVHLPPPPHDDQPYVGQPNYAPYELLYPAARETTWHRRRYGCDVFLLGNLIFTSFVGGSLTALVMHALPSELHPANFTAPYEEVIPDLEQAHSLLVAPFMSEAAPQCIAHELTALILRLCHPDPTRRGLDKVSSKGERPYNIHRVVGTLNTLALRAKFYAKG